MNEALKHSSGGILRLGKFCLFFRCPADQVFLCPLIGILRRPNF
jgi:hypothetical protein